MKVRGLLVNCRIDIQRDSISSDVLKEILTTDECDAVAEVLSEFLLSTVSRLLVTNDCLPKEVIGIKPEVYVMIGVTDEGPASLPLVKRGLRPGMN
jgi:hypothetical protein